MTMETLQSDSVGETLDVGVIIISELPRLVWAKDGKCNDGSGVLAGRFYSKEHVDVVVSKACCQECKVRKKCLEFAIESGEEEGVWGGEYFLEGKIAPTPQRRGRPSKHQSTST